MIYCIQAVGGGLIKIGRAIDVSVRLRQLQHKSPVRLRILATVEGDYDVESQLHKRFRSCRHHGEWFRPTRKLMAFIEREAEPWTQPLPRFARRRRRKLVPVGPPNPVGRPMSVRGARTQVIAIKAYPEWKEWLEEFRAKRGDMNLVDVVDAGLKLLARVEKFREPPPR